MARHASPKNPTARRALLAVATAGAALGAGAATASAATGPVLDVMPTRPALVGDIDPQEGLPAATGAVGHATGTLAGLKPNPLAGTGVDPLDNGVATQVADFAPLSSRSLTGPVAQAPSLGSVPVVGQLLGSVR
ncbi:MULTISPECIES: hypothetical protein [Streptomyces]|uniref:hypothetical protein n=1 Tax=Streptomyces TaxID=1883 RepID=UPI00136F8161|nr:hypothetical protein [Streptomyces sp. SID2888]MYV48751.1 hypothetical protein [Streptomyces sp. SID2888]